jgi:phosphonate transport system substrate-binding protein
MRLNLNILAAMKSIRAANLSLVFAVSLALLHFTAPPVVAADAKPLKKFVVALKPDKDPDAMIEERRTLTAFLSPRVGRPVEVIVPLSSAVIIEGFANGTIDLAYISATETRTAWQRGAAEVLLANERDGKPYYLSYWLALKEKPYTSIADLKGKPVAFASKTSTSGYLIPHWMLIKRGLLPPHADPEVFFGKGNTWYGNGYVSAVQRVLDRSVEAAAVSYYVLEHLTAEQRSRLKKIDEQGPVPTHCMAVRKGVNAADRAALKKALLALNEGDHTALRDKLFTFKLVEADTQKHIGDLDEALRLTEPKK